MSNKEIVIDLVHRLPSSATLMEIAQEIELIAGVREGLDEIDRGEGVEAQEVRKLIPTLITK